MWKLLTGFISLCIMAQSVSYSQYLKPEKLPGINSYSNELNPVLSKDGKTLYYTRGEYDKNIGLSDIWFSTLDINGNWSEPVNIGEPLNNQFDNFACSISKNGNLMLLGSEYKADGTAGPGISISRKTETGWSYPEAISVEDYYNYNQFAGFFLSEDGKTLLLTLDRDDSNGEKDIYISFLKDNNTWTKPKNLGNIINSEEDEISPYLTIDNRTLYFSSKGHGGYGSADIFMSKRIGDSWYNWTKPVNLGPSINSIEWEAYFKITPNRKEAYFVTMKNAIGGTDIFKTQLPPEMWPDIEVPATLVVHDYSSGLPMHCFLTVKNTAENAVLSGFSESGGTGYHNGYLKTGCKYDVHITAPGFNEEMLFIDLKNEKDVEFINKEIYLKKKYDTVYSARNVLFETGSAEPTDGFFLNEMKKLTEFLKSNPDCIVRITGHTDEVGTPVYNQDLSMKRATRIADYLVKEGIAVQRIETDGKGYTQPLIKSDLEELRKYNRRVEFLIYKSEKNVGSINN